MDTFLEQIIKIRLDGKAKGYIIAIILVDLLLVAGIIALSFLFAPAFLFLILVAVVYGSYKLLSAVSVEFEYIFTNGDLDVDKITARSSRKRMVSVKCSNAEKFGDYTGQAAPGSVKQTFYFCNRNSEGQVYMIVPDKSLGTIMIVLAPDEHMREAIEKAVPRLAK